MRGHRVYFDINVFIYFLDRNEDYFDKCLPFFQAVQEGSITGVTGELTIAELLVKPMSTHNIVGAEKVRALFDDPGYFQALPHDRGTLELAAQLRATQKLSMIGAIHLSTAIRAQCSHIITNDEQLARCAQGIEVIRLESD